MAYGAPPPPAPESLRRNSLSASSDDDAEESEEEKMEAKKEEEVVEAAPAEMRAIIMKQKASGSWSLSDVASLLGSLSAEKIKKILSSLIQGDCSGDVENLWITAVVVAFLQVCFPLLPFSPSSLSSLSDSLSLFLSFSLSLSTGEMASSENQLGVGCWERTEMGWETIQIGFGQT